MQARVGQLGGEVGQLGGVEGQLGKQLSTAHNERDERADQNVWLGDELALLCTRFELQRRVEELGTELTRRGALSAGSKRTCSLGSPRLQLAAVSPAPDDDYVTPVGWGGSPAGGASDAEEDESTREHIAVTVCVNVLLPKTLHLARVGVNFGHCDRLRNRYHWLAKYKDDAGVVMMCRLTAVSQSSSVHASQL